VTAPSTEEYQHLLQMLRGSAHNFEKAEDDRGRLQASLECYRHLLRYLRRDPEIQNGPIIRSLEFLRVKVTDIERGAKPFENTIKPDGKGSKPTGTNREHIQGMIAYAFEVLRLGGLNRRDALQWLTVEVRKAGFLTENGSAITKDQLEGWRNEIRRNTKNKASAGAPVTACEQFDLLQAEYTLSLRSITDSDTKRAHAYQLAKALVKTVRSAGTNVAPNRRSIG